MKWQEWEGNVDDYSLSAVEATTVRVLLLHDDSLFIFVGCFVGAIAGNVSFLVWMMNDDDGVVDVIDIGCKTLKLGMKMMISVYNNTV